MTEIFDFGRHTPYIFSAYLVSAIVITLLIMDRRRRLIKSLAQDKSEDAEK